MIQARQTTAAAFLSAGFRPFYLGAAAFALLSIPLWVATYAATDTPGPAISTLLWHSHEMIFGFATAVIVGFLLTAVRNWTGNETAAGAGLAALFGLWIAARLANWAGNGLLPILLDGAFLSAATVTLALPIVKTRNRRNYFVPVLLLGLTVAAVLHGMAIRYATHAWTMPTIAMDLILLLMITIAGRVIPAFSQNAVAGLAPARWLPLEILAMATAICLLLVDLYFPDAAGPWWLLFCAISAGIHLTRLAGWKAWRTIGNPLLLALPLAYLWIPIHFLIRALEPALALHALTVGAMASLMLAMMTRSALGHTGRPLAARPVELICFLAIHLAAISRVLGPVLAPASYAVWLWLAAGFWVLAFGVFFLSYWPILTRARVDVQTST